MWDLHVEQVEHSVPQRVPFLGKSLKTFDEFVSQLNFSIKIPPLTQSFLFLHKKSPFSLDRDEGLTRGTTLIMNT